MCQSGYISIDITGTMTCPLRRLKDACVDGYLLVSSSDEDSTQFIKIEPPEPNTKPLYCIVNRLQEFSVLMYQSCY